LQYLDFGLPCFQAVFNMRRLSAHPSPKTQVQLNKKRLDYGLLSAVVLLVFAGLIMVYDSSVVQAFKDYGDKYFYIKQQAIWVILGFFCLTFFSLFNYNLLKRFALFGLIVAFVLLIAVLIPGLGVSAGGAHRWLRIGGVTIQPAEIIKLASIVFFAAIFEKKSRLIPFAVVVFSASLIIGLFQRDLGSTIVYFLTSVLIYLVAGAPLVYFLAFIPVSIIGFLFFVLSSTYRKQRVLAFLDPFADPQGYTYHISQVLIAIGSGGFLGMGLGQSRQKFEYIPEVTTDSIFAIVGEEFGFIGAVALIGLISFLLYKGFKISENAPDDFGRILAFGLTIWLGIQSVINLGAMVSLIPLTGVPLPFISYGGSALLANLVAIGILLNISKYSKK
jgi:cell division protein FtsW